MIFEIIGWVILILLIPTFIYLFRKARNPNTYQNGLYMTIAVISVIVFILLLLFAISGSFVDNTAKYQFSIVSLRMDSTIRGSFFLGTGTISEEKYYYAYKKTTKGLVLEEIPLIENNCNCNMDSRIYIIETNEISPRYVDETVCEESASLLNWIQNCERTRKLIVPKGTIIREFRL